MSTATAGERSAAQWEPFMGALRARLARERRRRRAFGAAAATLALAFVVALAAFLDQRPPARGALLFARVPGENQAPFQTEGPEVTRLPSGAWLVGSGGGAP